MTLQFESIPNLEHLIVNDRSPVAGQPINDGINGLRAGDGKNGNIPTGSDAKSGGKCRPALLILRMGEPYSPGMNPLTEISIPLPSGSCRRNSANGMRCGRAAPRRTPAFSARSRVSSTSRILKPK